jgi:hypothetical protein
MAPAPVLTGLNRTQAEAAVIAAGFVPNYSGTLDTSTSSYHGLIATQSVIGNSLLDYESTISFTLYNYVSGGGGTPIPPPVCQARVDRVLVSESPCSGSPGYKTLTYSKTTYYADCSHVGPVTEYEYPACYVEPCAGGTYDTGGTGCGSWSIGPCQLNYSGSYVQTLTRTCRDSYCATTTQTTTQSCTPAGGGGTYY